MVKRSRVPYLLMVLPGVALFFFFHTYPVLQGIFYSFTDFRGWGDYEFVGLRNYINVFRDSRVLDAYTFTFLFAVSSTVLVNVFGLLIALGLNSKRVFGRAFLKTVYFLPYVFSLLIIGYIFSYFFAHILPAFGRTIGIEAISRNILGQQNTAWIGVVAVTVWQTSAFAMIIYLAGLQSIPTDLYDACSIDGGSERQQFMHVTFPLIAPFFTINMVVALKNFLMVFDQIISLTGGGPARATESVSVLIYRGGFEGGQFAYQSANAVILLLVITIVSLIQLNRLQKREVQL